MEKQIKLKFVNSLDPIKLILERLFGSLGSAADSLGGQTEWDQMRAGILQHHSRHYGICRFTVVRTLLLNDPRSSTRQTL